jgi:hypothetical protein
MTETYTPRPLDLDNLVLDDGGHAENNNGEMCLLEAAAYMAGEPWSDHPQCVCPTLGAFGRSLNDRLPDDKRQLLKPLLPELLGTADDGHREARGYMALDWLIRTYLPAWLSLTERIDPSVAQRIRELPPIVDLASARAAGEVVRDARQKAAAAWAAAWAAAGDAARAAAWAAAGDAARAAAWDAARAAAGDAARAAAGDAATQKLAPTVAELQDSAIELFGRMVRAGREEAA